MAFAPAILGVLGTVVSAGGSILAGQQAKAAANFEAKQLERQANEKRAQATREVAQQYADRKELMGNQIAVAAASGGGASDPTVMDLLGDTAAYGYVQNQNTYANAENIGRQLEGQADAKRIEGKNAQTASFINAGSSLLSGLSGTMGQKSQIDMYRSMMPQKPAYG